jgi:hypothetical protein
VLLATKHADFKKRTSHWPAGEQYAQDPRCSLEAFRNRWGRVSGTLIVSPAWTTTVSPRQVAANSPCRTIKLSSSHGNGWRTSTGGTYMSMTRKRPPCVLGR